MPKDRRPKAKVICTSCGASRSVPMEKFSVGDILKPFAGGGTFGRCLKCKRTGLRVVEVPQEPLKRPRGWAKIPEE